MKLFFTIVVNLLVLFAVSAQDIKFGDNVTLAELEEKQCDIDSSANAAYLYKYRNTYYTYNSGGLELITEIHEKIKVYNKDGFDATIKEVNLFRSGNASEKMSKLKAITYNLNGGAIEETKLDKDEVFKSRFNDSYNQVKFTMPNVKEGSVIEYKYKVSSPFYMHIDEFRFQEKIPVKKIKAIFSAIDIIDFKPIVKGYIPLHPRKDVKSSASLGRSLNVDTYILTDVPALREEAFVDNIDNYTAGVNYEIRSIERETTVKYYTQSWKDVAQSIGNTEDYKENLDKNKPIRAIVDSLVTGTSSDEEKMKAIYKYVKNDIKWNGGDGRSFYKGIKKVLKEKKGNAGDINLTLVAMLRYAGLEANPLVICTKDNGIPYFPTLDMLNYVLAYVELNGKEYFMDATQEFSDINLLPLRDYNWQGVYVNNEKMLWKLVDLPAPKQAASQIQLNINVSDDGSMEGDYKSKKTNHYAYLFRENMKNKDLETHIASREEDFSGIEISDYELKNIDTYEGAVNEDFTFYQEDAIEVSSDKIIITPLSFLAIDENPFKLDERKYPVDFGHAFKEMIIASITLPEGYQSETQRKPFVAKLPNDMATFKYMVHVVGNTLKVTSVVNFKKAKYFAEDYLLIKEFFNQIIAKQTEPIVLKKQ